MINKEYGSDFPLLVDDSFLLNNQKENIFCTNAFSLFFSGRSALYHLLKSGIELYNWQKVYVPSFYCHEVVYFLKDLDIEVVYYEYNPFLDLSSKTFEWDDKPSTVVVNVLFFGVKKLDVTFLEQSIVLEDLTHNIMGFESSNADYCFGSLRKELPLPCGGFLMSPKGKSLPIGVESYKSEIIGIQKLTAMMLKKEYLEGRITSKDIFRNLFTDSESEFENRTTNAAIPLVSLSILKYLNIPAILSAKYENVKLALSLLKKKSGIRYNMDYDDSNSFGLVVECETVDLKLKMKQFLIENKVFPAVLWPNQLLARDEEVSSRILFVHLDFRYDKTDIEEIIKMVNIFNINE